MYASLNFQKNTELGGSPFVLIPLKECYQKYSESIISSSTPRNTSRLQNATNSLVFEKLERITTKS